MAIVEPTEPAFRFILLFFNCMLTFGSYFCFDMPSVLQEEFQKEPNCTNSSSTSCCNDCLGMTAADYNLLYAIYAWMNAVVVLAAGFLIDKLGNRIGLFLFSFLCVIGSSIFALGSMFRNTRAMLPLMLLGRLIFGSGNGSLTIVQNRITAFWFHNKELALAFGTTLAFSRLGSVLNFFLTESFEQKYVILITLWGGAALCGLGFISAIIVSVMDKYGIRRLGVENTLSVAAKKLKVTDIKHFSLSYWLVALSIMFFYNGVFPFVADASKFIQDKYKYSSTDSAYMAGAVYDVSMLLSPFLGGVIDVFGQRGVLAVLCAVLTIPVFGLLAFSFVPPLVSTIWLGITYSFAAASLWPSIPLVVTQATVGTAMGLTTSIQMIGIGISNVIVGKILGDQHPTKLINWKYVMIFLLANTLACVVTTVILNIVDKRRGKVLNQSRAQRRRQQSLLHNTASAHSEVSHTINETSHDTETDPLLPKE